MKLIQLPAVRTLRAMRRESTIARQRVKGKKIRHNDLTDYQKFISSKEWKMIRNKALDYFKVCAICGCSFRLQVHHRTYKRFGGKELLKDLALLCDKDHRYISLFPNGLRRKQKEQDKLFVIEVKFYPPELL